MTERMGRREYTGEILGTFLLVLLGCSAVAIAVLYKQDADLFSAGLSWGFAVAIAVWVAGSLSGAHINPAVTLGMAAIGRFPWRRVPAFWGCQILGAFLGAVAVWLVFGSAIDAFAAKESIEFGAPGSERAGLILVPYSPHPWIVGIDQAAYAAVPVWRGLLTEWLGTAVLVMVVLALLETRSINSPVSWSFPLAVAALICMLTVLTAAHTMTSLNPARDLGPRTMLWLMGFGEVAFPGPRDGLSMLITVAGPLLGGGSGAVFFHRVLEPLFETGHAETVAAEASSRAEDAVLAETGAGAR